VVDAQDLVIDDTLHLVEGIAPHQQGAGEQLSGLPHTCAASRSPQDDEAEQYEEADARVEQAISECVDLELGNAVGRIASAGEHVVPLQYLVQHDPVEEAAQAQPEQDASGGGKFHTAVIGVAHGRHPLVAF
jgi:hypothetical protein